MSTNRPRLIMRNNNRDKWVNIKLLTIREVFETHYQKMLMAKIIRDRGQDRSWHKKMNGIITV